MKRVLITGITGTMGQELSRTLLEQPDYEIIGISRDEQKLQQIPTHPRLKLRIADVRDGAAVARAIRGNIDLVFHLAALKCVDILESHPDEAFHTNVIGTQNIIELSHALQANMVFTSTDKACYPINVYGQTKALAEKMVLNAGFTVARYGNVIGSRGSFVPNLILSLKAEGKVYLTHPEMSRFWMSASQVAEFLIESAAGGNGLEIPYSIRSSSVENFIKAVASFCKVEKYETEIVGVRPGEKIHETLKTAEEGEKIGSFDLLRQYDQKSLEHFIADALRGVA